jgi:GH25 family lysozyme M1 (1,4-beta-N-acetylmuramidase)
MTFDPIFVDEYAYDKASDWNALVSAGLPWAGALLKVTQGLTYSSGTWLKWNWPAVAAARRNASRTDFVRGAYHYLMFADDGAKQAEYFLSELEAAGGLQPGDFTMMDVESADNGSPSAQQVIDCGSAFAEAIFKETRSAPVLYGESLMYDLGITNRMGCRWIIIPRYTATLPQGVVTRVGWTESELLAWQFREANGGPTFLKAPDGTPYPSTAPGCGDVDMSVLTYPGGLSALCAILYGQS